MSVERGDCPVESKTSIALILTSLATVDIVDEDAVEQVSSTELIECDATGQRECVGLWGSFTPGPDENPLYGMFH